MEESSQEVSSSEFKPKKGLTEWQIVLIVAAVMVAICCLCLLVLLLLAPALLSPALGNVFSAIIETREAITPMP